jgi:spore germination protein YaaH
MKNIWEKFAYFVFPLIIGMLLGIAVVIFYINKDDFQAKFLSPLGFDPIIGASKVPSEKPILGFLPYWNLDSAEISYHLIDWLIYFSVSLDGNGNIVKNEGKNIDMGWNRLQSKALEEIMEKAKKSEVKTAIAITVFQNENIDAILQNPDVSTNAIASIVKIVDEYGFDGVNLDFEYNLGKEIVYGAGENYKNFIVNLRESLNEVNPDISITVDIYGNGLIQNFPYKAEVFVDETDWLILMGYDYHVPASDHSGPVAPLYCSDEKSIMESIEAGLEKQIDSKKIILAMPFYGYQWQTVSDEYKSNTIPNSGSTASYKRVMKIIEEEELDINWDSEAMSPWIAFTENGVWNQIYFENDDSIGLKLDLIDQVDLGGGAIWALGYEGENASVWKTIEEWRVKESN